MLKDCSFNSLAQGRPASRPELMRTVALPLSVVPLKAKKAWLLTVLLSTAELSETLVGVFLPGPQARVVAGGRYYY